MTDLGYLSPYLSLMYPIQPFTTNINNHGDAASAPYTQSSNMFWFQPSIVQTYPKNRSAQQPVVREIGCHGDISMSSSNVSTIPSAFHLPSVRDFYSNTGYLYSLFTPSRLSGNHVNSTQNYCRSSNNSPEVPYENRLYVDGSSRILPNEGSRLYVDGSATCSLVSQGEGSSCIQPIPTQLQICQVESSTSKEVLCLENLNETVAVETVDNTQMVSSSKTLFNQRNSSALVISSASKRRSQNSSVACGTVCNSYPQADILNHSRIPYCESSQNRSTIATGKEETYQSNTMCDDITRLSVLPYNSSELSISTLPLQSADNTEKDCRQSSHVVMSSSGTDVIPAYSQNHTETRGHSSDFESSDNYESASSELASILPSSPGKRQDIEDHLSFQDLESCNVSSVSVTSALQPENESPKKSSLNDGGDIVRGDNNGRAEEVNKEFMNESGAAQYEVDEDGCVSMVSLKKNGLHAETDRTSTRARTRTKRQFVTESDESTESEDELNHRNSFYKNKNVYHNLANAIKNFLQKVHTEDRTRADVENKLHSSDEKNSLIKRRKLNFDLTDCDTNLSQLDGTDTFDEPLVAKETRDHVIECKANKNQTVQDLKKCLKNNIKNCEILQRNKTVNDYLCHWKKEFDSKRKRDGLGEEEVNQSTDIILTTSRQTEEVGKHNDGNLRNSSGLVGTKGRNDRKSKESTTKRDDALNLMTERMRTRNNDKPYGMRPRKTSTTSTCSADSDRRFRVSRIKDMCTQCNNQKGFGELRHSNAQEKVLKTDVLKVGHSSQQRRSEATNEQRESSETKNENKHSRLRDSRKANQHDKPENQIEGSKTKHHDTRSKEKECQETNNHGAERKTYKKSHYNTRGKDRELCKINHYDTRSKEREISKTKLHQTKSKVRDTCNVKTHDPRSKEREPCRTNHNTKSKEREVSETKYHDTRSEEERPCRANLHDKRSKQREATKTNYHAASCKQSKDRESGTSKSEDSLNTVKEPSTYKKNQPSSSHRKHHDTSLFDQMNLQDTSDVHDKKNNIGKKEHVHKQSKQRESNKNKKISTSINQGGSDQTKLKERGNTEVSGQSIEQPGDAPNKHVKCFSAGKTESNGRQNDRIRTRSADATTGLKTKSQVHKLRTRVAINKIQSDKEKMSVKNLTGTKKLKMSSGRIKSQKVQSSKAHSTTKNKKGDVSNRYRNQNCKKRSKGNHSDVRQRGRKNPHPDDHRVSSSRAISVNKDRRTSSVRAVPGKVRFRVVPASSVPAPPVKKRLPCCCYCGKFRCLTLKLLHQHIQKQHRFHCFRCKKVFTGKEEWITHKTVHVTEQHHCLLCQRDFTSLHRYECHLKSREHGRLEHAQRTAIDIVYSACLQRKMPSIANLRLDNGTAQDATTDSIMAPIRSDTSSNVSSTDSSQTERIRHFYHQSPELQNLLHQIESFDKCALTSGFLSSEVMSTNSQSSTQIPCSSEPVQDLRNTVGDDTLTVDKQSRSLTIPCPSELIQNIEDSVGDAPSADAQSSSDETFAPNSGTCQNDHQPCLSSSAGDVISMALRVLNQEEGIPDTSLHLQGYETDAGNRKPGSADFSNHMNQNQNFSDNDQSAISIQEEYEALLSEIAKDVMTSCEDADQLQLSPHCLSPGQSGEDFIRNYMINDFNSTNNDGSSVGDLLESYNEESNHQGAVVTDDRQQTQENNGKLKLMEADGTVEKNSVTLKKTGDENSHLCHSEQMTDIQSREDELPIIAPLTMSDKQQNEKVDCNSQIHGPESQDDDTDLGVDESMSNKCMNARQITESELKTRSYLLSLSITNICEPQQKSDLTEVKINSETELDKENSDSLSLPEKQEVTHSVKDLEKNQQFEELSDGAEHDSENEEMCGNKERGNSVGVPSSERDAEISPVVELRVTQNTASYCEEDMEIEDVTKTDKNILDTLVQSTDEKSNSSTDLDSSDVHQKLSKVSDINDDSEEFGEDEIEKFLEDTGTDGKLQAFAQVMEKIQESETQDVVSADSEGPGFQRKNIQEQDLLQEEDIELSKEIETLSESMDWRTQLESFTKKVEEDNLCDLETILESIEENRKLEEELDTVQGSMSQDRDSTEERSAAVYSLPQQNEEDKTERLHTSYEKDLGKSDTEGELDTGDTWSETTEESPEVASLLLEKNEAYHINDNSVETGMDKDKEQRVKYTNEEFETLPDISDRNKRVEILSSAEQKNGTAEKAQNCEVIDEDTVFNHTEANWESHGLTKDIEDISDSGTIEYFSENSQGTENGITESERNILKSATPDIVTVTDEDQELGKSSEKKERESLHKTSVIEDLRREENPPPEGKQDRDSRDHIHSDNDRASVVSTDDTRERLCNDAVSLEVGNLGVQKKESILSKQSSKQHSEGTKIDSRNKEDNKDSGVTMYGIIGEKRSDCNINNVYSKVDTDLPKTSPPEASDTESESTTGLQIDRSNSSGKKDDVIVINSQNHDSREDSELIVYTVSGEDDSGDCDFNKEDSKGDPGLNKTWFSEAGGMPSENASNKQNNSNNRFGQQNAQTTVNPQRKKMCEESDLIVCNFTGENGDECVISELDSNVDPDMSKTRISDSGDTQRENISRRLSDIYNNNSQKTETTLNTQREEVCDDLDITVHDIIGKSSNDCIINKVNTQVDIDLLSESDIIELSGSDYGLVDLTLDCDMGNMNISMSTLDSLDVGSEIEIDDGAIMTDGQNIGENAFIPPISVVSPEPGNCSEKSDCSAKTLSVDNNKINPYLPVIQMDAEAVKNSCLQYREAEVTPEVLIHSGKKSHSRKDGGKSKVNLAVHQVANQILHKIRQEEKIQGFVIKTPSKNFQVYQTPSPISSQSEKQGKEKVNFIQNKLQPPPPLTLTSAALRAAPPGACEDNDVQIIAEVLSLDGQDQHSSSGSVITVDDRECELEAQCDKHAEHFHRRENEAFVPPSNINSVHSVCGDHVKNNRKQHRPSQHVNNFPSLIDFGSMPNCSPNLIMTESRPLTTIPISSYAYHNDRVGSGLGPTQIPQKYGGLPKPGIHGHRIPNILRKRRPHVEDYNQSSVQSKRPKLSALVMGGTDKGPTGILRENSPAVSHSNKDVIFVCEKKLESSQEFKGCYPVMIDRRAPPTIHIPVTPAVTVAQSRGSAPVGCPVAEVSTFDNQSNDAPYCSYISECSPRCAVPGSSRPAQMQGYARAPVPFMIQGHHHIARTSGTIRSGNGGGTIKTPAANSGNCFSKPVPRSYIPAPATQGVVQFQKLNPRFPLLNAEDPKHRYSRMPMSPAAARHIQTSNSQSRSTPWVSLTLNENALGTRMAVFTDVNGNECEIVDPPTDLNPRIERLNNLPTRRSNVNSQYNFAGSYNRAFANTQRLTTEANSNSKPPPSDFYPAPVNKNPLIRNSIPDNTYRFDRPGNPVLPNFQHIAATRPPPPYVSVRSRATPARDHNPHNTVPSSVRFPNYKYQSAIILD